MEKGKSRETIEDAADNLSRHKPAYSASDINHALIRANKDDGFLDSTIKLLDILNLKTFIKCEKRLKR
jgi:hypothetical protein